MSDYRDITVYVIVDDGDKTSIGKVSMTWNYEMVDGPEAIAEEIVEELEELGE